MRGIQNRDRCFCISILSKEFVDFDFPKPIPLTTVMRDYLEEKVDEKYYIKNEKANKLIKQLIDSGVLPTEQNRTEQIVATIDLSVNNTRSIKLANCIKARYNAGISNYQADGCGVVVGKRNTL